MPQIYLTQAEFEALEFFRGVAQAASESATDEVYCRDYAAACEAYSSVENKFYKGKAIQNGKAQVKRVLRQIKSENA